MLLRRTVSLRSSTVFKLSLVLPALEPLEEQDELFAGAYTINVSGLHFVSYCIIHQV